MTASRINYAWRLLCTALGFASFSIGGFVLAVGVYPLLALFSRDEAQRARRFRAILRLTFRLLLVVLDVGGVLRILVKGGDRLASTRGAVIVANHPSLIDVVILAAHLPATQCIVKPALWQHRFLGPVMRAAGYIPSDADGETMLRRCRESLGQGDNLLIFPEGTRSRPGAEIRFQRGFANIAVLAGAPILPVFIRCDPPTLLKGDRWYDIPHCRALFELDVKLPISVDAAAAPARGREARRLTREINGAFAGLVST